jgi:hypothetical protein
MDLQKLCILAIEPDAGCREHLHAFLAARIEADFVIVPSAEAAAGVMHVDRPDAVLISTMLPPRAEEQVVDALKHLDPDGIVPVMPVPPLLEAPVAVDAPRRVFGLIRRRRSAPPRPSYDTSALVTRIEGMLREVREEKKYPRIRSVRVESEPCTALIVRPGSTDLATIPTASIVNTARGPMLIERRRLDRSPRIAANELPAPCTLTTPTGLIVRLVNVSESGVLFESPLKFLRDAETLLSLFAPDTTHVLPSRIVRSEVSMVNGLGVTYQTAAQFNKTIELHSSISPRVVDAVPVPAAVVETPQSLADLLVRVTTELYQHQEYRAATLAFESGLRQLVPACTVRVSEALVQPGGGGDSIYFAVPGSLGLMVQATFEPGHEPTPEELKLLKAAAAIASVIVHGEPASLLRRTA